MNENKEPLNLAGTARPFLVDGDIFSAAHLDVIQDRISERFRWVRGTFGGAGWIRNPTDLTVNTTHSIEVRTSDLAAGSVVVTLSHLRVIGQSGSLFEVVGPVDVRVSVETDVAESCLLFLSQKAELPEDDGRPTTAPVMPRLTPRLTTRAPHDTDSICIGRLVVAEGELRVCSSFLGHASAIHCSERMALHTGALLDQMKGFDQRIHDEVARRRTEGLEVDVMLGAMWSRLGAITDVLSDRHLHPASFVMITWSMLRGLDRTFATILGEECVLEALPHPRAAATEIDSAPMFAELDRAMSLVNEPLGRAVGGGRSRGLVVKSMGLDTIEGRHGNWIRVRVQLSEPLGDTLAVQRRSHLKLTWPAPLSDGEGQTVEARFSPHPNSYPGRTSRRARLVPKLGNYVFAFQPSGSERDTKEFAMFIQGNANIESEQDLLLEMTT